MLKQQLLQYAAQFESQVQKTSSDADLLTLLEEFHTELISLKNQHSSCLLGALSEEASKYDSQVRACSQTIDAQRQLLLDCDKNFIGLLKREAANQSLSSEVRQSLEKLN